jgi:hypothetical protein
MKKILLIFLSSILVISGCSEKDTADIDNEPLNQVEESHYDSIMIAFKNTENLFNRGYVLGATKDYEWYKVEALDIPENIEDQYEEVVFENDYLSSGGELNLYNLDEFLTKTKVTETKLWNSPSGGEPILWAYFDDIKSEEDFLIASSQNLNFNNTYLKYSDMQKNIVNVDLDKNGIEDIIEVCEAIDSDGKKLYLRVVFNDNEMYADNLAYFYGKPYESLSLLIVDVNRDNKFEILSVAEDHNYWVNLFEVSEDGVYQVLSLYDGD